MLEAAARQFPIDKNSSWIIGDKWIDVRTGINFDIKQILVQTGKNGSDIEHQTTPTFIAKDLINAAELIISYK
jgi:histidinol phosphatase-like enzyme